MWPSAACKSLVLQLFIQLKLGWIYILFFFYTTVRGFYPRYRPSDQARYSTYSNNIFIPTHSQTRSHQMCSNRKQFGVQCLAQGHFDVQSGSRDWATDPLISGGVELDLYWSFVAVSNIRKYKIQILIFTCQCTDFYIFCNHPSNVFLWQKYVTEMRYF